MTKDDDVSRREAGSGDSEERPPEEEPGAASRMTVQEALLALSAIGSRPQSSERLCVLVTELVSRATSFPVVSLQLYDPVRRVMSHRAVHGAHLLKLNFSLPVEFSVEGTLSREALESGQSIVRYPEEQHFPRLNPILKSLGIRTYVGVPLVMDGAPRGVLALCDFDRRDISGETVELVEAVAKSASPLLSQRLSEDALLSSESELHGALLHTSMGAFFMGLDGVVLNANARVSEIVGLPSRELVGRSVFDFIHPESKAEVRRVMKRVLEGKDAPTLEVRGLRADGAPLWVLAMGGLLRSRDGVPLRYLVQVLDITAGKVAQAEAKRLERALVTLTECQRALIHATDEHQLLRDVCRVIHEVGGYPLAWVGYAEEDEARSVWPAAFAGQDGSVLFKANVSWDERSEYGHGVAGTAIRTGRPATLRHLSEVKEFAPWREFALRRDYAAALGLPLMERGKAFGAVIIFSDDEKAFDEQELRLLEQLSEELAYGVRSLRERIAHAKAVEALAENEARLKLVLESGSMGAWTWDFASRETRWTGHIARIFGGTDEACMAYHDFWRAIFPEDRARVRAALVKAIRTGEPYALEHRVLWPDGSVHWVAGRGQVNVDADGQRCGMSGIAVDVTDLKTAEMALQKSEEQYRLLFERMFSAFALHEIILDDHGRPVDYRFLVVNKAFEEFTGLEAKALIGRTLLEVAPEIEPVWIDIYGKVALTGEPVDFDHYSEALGRHYECRAYQTEPGRFAVLFLDITDRKRAEMALQYSELRYRELFNNANDAIFLFRVFPDGALSNFEEVNDVACRWLGYSRDELLRLSVLDLLPPEEGANLGGRTETLLSSGQVLVESIHRAKDGRLIPVEVHARQFELAGERFVLSMARDISERKQAEKERQALEARMRQTQKLESLGVLAGGIAHDFNNLLTGIWGNLELALHDVPTLSPLRETLEEVQSAARRAAELTLQMLAYTGRVHFSPKAMSLTRLVRDNMDLIEASVPRSSKLTYELERDLPLIEGDAAPIRQALMNLVANAHEAMHGRGTITVSTGVRRCDASYFAQGFTPEIPPEGDYVSLAVSDTGCGIDGDTLGKVFDPFFSTKFTGRGLGLAAVLGVARSHGGTVRVTSRVGEGSTFEILIPKALKQAPRTIATETAENPKTVLVVESDASVSRLARRVLERGGFLVLEAPSVTQALELLEGRGNVVDGVLLESHEGAGEVTKLVAELRRRLPAIPIVLAHESSKEQAARHFAGLELSGFVQKPYNVGDLTHTLRAALYGREA